jgi:hypothetical protein
VKKYFLLAAVVLIGGIAINYSLGGFTKVEPKLIEVNNYVIYGTAFEGSYKSDELTILVDNMRNHQLQIANNTDLVVVNYIDDTKETIGKISNFVGLVPDKDFNFNEPEEFEKRIIRATRAIRIEVKIKPLVMPSPEKIKNTAIEFAIANKLKLQNLSIEKYQENGVLVVEFPVVDTEEAKKLEFIEQLGNEYGIDKFDKSNTWHYTFNVEKGDVEVARNWTWHPATGEVRLIEKGDTAKFNHFNVAEDMKKIDHKFINDKYWLFFPFQLVWDSGYTFELMEIANSPISKIKLKKLTIAYNNKDGYTPGDAYDLYINEKMEIREWTFRKGGQTAPSLTTTWEGYKSIDGMKLATDHYSEDSLLRIWFTGVKITD